MNSSQFIVLHINWLLLFFELSVITFKYNHILICMTIFLVYFK